MSPEKREVPHIKFARSEDQITAALSQLDDCSEHVRPAETLDAVAGYVDDNRMLECVVSAQVEFIVTGDNHLLRLDQFRNIEMLKVSDFTALLPTL